MVIVFIKINILDNNCRYINKYFFLLMDSRYNMILILNWLLINMNIKIKVIEWCVNF